MREAIVKEALGWVGTPYRNTGRMKGVGVNCAQLLFGVAINSGAIPADSPEPKWFTSQMATHYKEERLIAYVESYGAREVTEPQPGDIVIYKTGQSYGHVAILIGNGDIVHCIPPGGCMMGQIGEGQLGRFVRRYFSIVKDGQ